MYLCIYLPTRSFFRLFRYPGCELPLRHWSPPRYWSYLHLTSGALPHVGRTTTCVSQLRIFLRIDHRVISLWSPALPTLQAVHALYLPLIFHLVFWVCALFEGCVATNCASRAFIQCLSSDLSPRYFSVQRTATSAAVHSFFWSWFVPHVLSLRTFAVKSMRTTICASWRFLF